MRSKRAIAVLGVVFEKNKRFLRAYLSSLEKQTDKDFDLILVNDGMKQLQRITEPYDLSIKIWNYRGTPAKIRQKAINRVRREGYRFLVFTDSDDHYAPNRVKISRDLLKKYDVVANDLSVMSVDGRLKIRNYFSKRLGHECAIKVKDILDKNIFGFTNTAIRLSCLRNAISFREDLMAADWYFFTKALNEGCSAVFTGRTCSYYRVYEGNVMGLTVGASAERQKKALEVKYRHYRALKNESHALAQRFASCRQMKFKSIKRPFWWEEIRCAFH